MASSPYDCVFHTIVHDRPPPNSARPVLSHFRVPTVLMSGVNSQSKRIQSIIP